MQTVPAMCRGPFCPRPLLHVSPLSAYTLSDWLLSVSCLTDSGVSERHQNLSSWMDYGFISYSTLYVSHKDCGACLCLGVPRKSEVSVLSFSPKYVFALDIAFSSTRYSPHQGGGERSYGPFFWPNDTVGVVLNMDEGYMAFVKDAEVSVPAHIHQPI